MRALRLRASPRSQNKRLWPQGNRQNQRWCTQRQRQWVWQAEKQRQRHRNMDSPGHLDRQMVDAFLYFVGSAGVPGIMDLLNFELIANSVYVYSHPVRSAHSCVDEAAAWPVVWLLGVHRRKFLFQGQAKPQLRQVWKTLSYTCEQLRWRWFLRGSPQEQFRNFAVRRSLCPPPCPERCPEVEGWIGRFRDHIISETTRIFPSGCRLG